MNYYLVALDEGVWGPTTREECEKLLERDAAITSDTRAEALEIWTNEQVELAEIPAADISPIADFISYLDEEEGN